ncbi:ribonuclease HII [Candidatus Bathyarchaeota archaeon]|nr:ribonuclease HII [Candidatus Bathyarchaeota archaeon]MBS7629998.1 ribonuclease HII [Candidatus Bathyarchaeota archaeon]
MKTIAGIDEAGRGCIIGPLVVAGISILDIKMEELKQLSVRDSKKLTAFRREILSKEIEKISNKIFYFELDPMVIDEVVFRGVRFHRLNYLEAMAMAKIIRDLEPDIAYVDPSDVSPHRFSTQILRVLRNRPELICEHKADEKYPIVSAASILAKVRRDRRVAELREKYGDFGSGYPSDKKTVSFLVEWLRCGKKDSRFIRHSWKTLKKLQF